MLTALIIDDEYLARRRVEKLLETHTDVQVLGEAKNGQEAVELIQYKSPDLIFLDVEMPDFGGFEVIKKLRQNTAIPYLIFTTAYDQYAVAAFAVDAIDYLLKPLEEDRFSAALSRARRQLALKRSEETTSQIMKMLFQLEDNGNSYRTAFELKENGRSLTLEVRNIIMLSSNGNYVDLITDDRKYLYRGTMHTLEKELNPQEFIRIHRSHIVNARYIRSCHYLSNNEYKLQMKNGTTVVSGRGYKEHLTRYLEMTQNG